MSAIKRGDWTGGGCSCESCRNTDSLRLAGFDKWPTGNPAGKRASESEYRSHWSHCGAEFNRKPKAAPVEKPFVAGWSLYPSPVVRDWITRSYTWRDSVMPTWEDGTGKRSRPVSVLVAKARQYREQARQERRAA